MDSLLMSLDWLSFSFRPPRELVTDTFEFLSLIIDVMHLGDVWKRAVHVGKNKYYSSIYRINDISFKCSSDYTLYTTGCMIEFSGNGLSIYQEMLADMKLDLVSVLRDVRSLVASGIRVNCCRCDIAIDDIAKDGEKPLLNMQTIYDKWRKREFCSRSSAVDRAENLDYKTDDDIYIKKGKVCDKRLKGRLGRTVYFGCRKSSVCVRFYDKLTEQLQKFNDVPNDVVHWVRCEYEYHNERANAIISMLIDNTFEEFKKLFARAVLGHLRFITMNDTNRARCNTSRWWLRFLRCLEGDGLKLRTVPKQTVKADKTVRWLRKSCMPSIYAYIACFGAEEFITDVVNSGKHNLSFNQLQFINDVVNSSPIDTIDGSFLPAVCWGWLSSKGFDAALHEINRDYNNLQCVKKYKNQLGGSLDKLVKLALGLVAA